MWLLVSRPAYLCCVDVFPAFDRIGGTGVGAGVEGGGADQLAEPLLFEDVCRPASGACAREHGRLHVRGDLGEVEDYRAAQNSTLVSMARSGPRLRNSLSAACSSAAAASTFVRQGVSRRLLGSRPLLAACPSLSDKGKRFQELPAEAPDTTGWLVSTPVSRGAVYSQGRL